jgi:predicted AAA+ superfamily ATPase
MVIMDINRCIFNKLYDDHNNRFITILIGARQVGKTHLLRKLEHEFRKKGLSHSFFDLEQPSDLVKFKNNDSEVINLLTNSGDVVFIDEFHYLKNISHILKAIYDGQKKVKIYASGSSSLEIHKHLKESLAGRKIIHRIFPCSLNEMSQVIKKNDFVYYCKFGGMPGLIHHPDENIKKMILSDILQSYLLKDIKSMIREENIRAFNNLLFLLAQYQGSLVTSANLSREIGVSLKTVDAYLEILSQTYVNFPLHSFSLNYGNELKKSKKYYLYDLGIRNVLLKNFDTLEMRKDAGAIVESFVFEELYKQLTPETEIRFWRLKSGEEVDFIWLKNQRYYPVEVKTRVSKGEITRGLKAFFRKYPDCKTAFIVNKDLEETICHEGRQIIYKKWINSSSIPSEIP